MASLVAESESFNTLEHRIEGKVSFIIEDGISYLEFDKSFKTKNIPDFKINLYHGNILQKYGIKEKDYVGIAPLQKISSSQRYALPNNVKL
ncbi:DM13 domain-containing protein [Trichormus azollae]|uniref:DM13 domain-containing protein n=1 Tax=Trichormus azollae TaxID=1164 RepID=UPI00325CE75D